MESPEEADRLLLKSDAETSKEQLLLTGLKKGMTAIDAGGGAGFVTKIMASIVGPKGNAILCDQSQARLDAAQDYHKGARNISYLCSPLEKIPLPNGVADYVFCRFVFEYLSDQEAVFEELKRLLKRGGKLVVGDLDYNCMSHHPLSEELENQLHEIVMALQKIKYFDPYAGRKLFSYFYRHKMRDVQVHFLPHHLIYGESEERDVKNWDQKLRMVQELEKKGVLSFDFDLEKFRKKFMKFFQDPGRFSYSPLILVEGVR